MNGYLQLLLREFNSWKVVAYSFQNYLFHVVSIYPRIRCVPFFLEWFHSRYQRCTRCTLSSYSCQQKAKQYYYIKHFYQCLIDHRLTQFLPIQPKDDRSQRCSLVTSNEFSRLREVLGSGKSADAKATAVGLLICLPLTWLVFIKREGTILIMHGC